MLLAAVLAFAPVALFSARPAVGLLHRHGYIFFDIEETGCLPWEWYWGSIDTQVITRGDIVTFRNEQAALFSRGALMTKIVAGMPGDTVVIRQGVISINGQILGTLARGAQHFFKPVNTWDTRYRIPAGEYFVFGSEYRSYDSRYWGPIRHDQIVTKDTLLD